MVHLKLFSGPKEHAETGYGAQVTGIVLSVGPTTLLAVGNASSVGGQGQSRAPVALFTLTFALCFADRCSFVQQQLCI